MEKKIIILTSLIGLLVLIFFCVWLILGMTIKANDENENRNRAENFYNERNEKYNSDNSFKMDYTYDAKKNIGFLGGGGFTENNCWERYIVDAWTNEQMFFISLCRNEELTKDKLNALNNFWEKYAEIFKNE